MGVAWRRDGGFGALGDKTTRRRRRAALMATWRAGVGGGTDGSGYGVNLRVALFLARPLSALMSRAYTSSCAPWHETDSAYNARRAATTSGEQHLWRLSAAPRTRMTPKRSRGACFLTTLISVGRILLPALGAPARVPSPTCQHRRQ